MAFNIIEVDGVSINPISKRFPVEIVVDPHAINDPTIHTGILDDNQIPSGIMRIINHQTDPHTMIIDGRDVSIDGSKLDTIEVGAQVNNLSNAQAHALTAGVHTNWHNHDLFYYRKSELQTSGESQVHWLNITNKPSVYTPDIHTHNDLYYLKTELDSGQLNNLYYTESEIDTLLLNYSLTGHSHNDLYYTETEVNTLLLSYSLTTHIHDDRYYTETEIDTLLLGKANAIHNHDDRYYTETEIDTLLLGKANAIHNHNDLYYTEAEIDTLLLNYSITSHIHDDRYYTETEIDTLLLGKSNTGHSHNDLYYTETESDNKYSLIGHSHNDLYYTETEVNTLLLSYSLTTHIHDDRYYTEGEVDSLLSALETYGIKGAVDYYSELPASSNEGDIYIVREDEATNLEGFYRWSGVSWIWLSHNTTVMNHNHDDRYYTESEVDTLLLDKSNAGHSHNDLYYTETESDNKYSLIGHSHNDLYYTESEIDTLLLNYSITSHIHDDRYYTETEIDTLFLGYSLTGHSHNDLYYTETEVNTLLLSYSLTGHSHNDLYYTETEVDTLLNALPTYGIINSVDYYSNLPASSKVGDIYIVKQNEGSNLEGFYRWSGTSWILIARNLGDFTATHNSLSGLNDGDFKHLTASQFSALTSGNNTTIHRHDARYYTESEMNTLLLGKSDVGHTHDDRYYTESEIDTLLLNKSNAGHSHNDLYYTESEIDTLLLNYSITSHIHDDRYYTETQLQSDVDGSSGADLIKATPVSSGLSNTVQGILEELASKVQNVSVSLDEAYTAGNQINITTSPVIINSSSSTAAPLQLTNRSSSPTTGLVAGQISVINNEFYIYNSEKAKWLTPSKIISYGYSGNADGVLLRTAGYADNGYKMSRKGTITSISLKSTIAVNSKVFNIIINSTVAATYSTDINGEFVSNALNIDFSSNDVIYIEISSAGPPLRHPSCNLEICWRE